MRAFCSWCGMVTVILVLMGGVGHAGGGGKAVSEMTKAPQRGAVPAFLGMSSAKHAAPQKKYQEDALLVKFRPAVSEDRKKNLHKKHGAEKQKEFRRLRLHLVKLKNGMSVQDALKLYQTDPDVEYAEPDFIYQSQGEPNDSRFGEQWGLHNTGQYGGTPGADIEAPAAWDITTGSGDVVVAVIDSGIDYSHPDLQQNIWVNSAEIPGNSLDDDGNGYIDDVYGINTLNGSGNSMDDRGHGTHVAGIIGAAGNNGIGVVGVNWNVKMMACKFLDSQGDGPTSGAIECLQYVKAMRDRGVPVVASNNSWGGEVYSQALSDAIGDQGDSLFVAATGNYRADTDKYPFYPAGYALPNVISVAASDYSDQMEYFSNYGRRSVHVAAPGTDIFSTMPAVNSWGFTGGYATLSGTSMAAPHVTGVVALLKAAAPGRQWHELRNLVLSGGDPVPALAPQSLTGRRINAFGSLTCSGQKVFSLLQYPAEVKPGVPVTISALSIGCAAALGTVEATSSAGESFLLHDDGVAPDLVAGDGTFSATWTPQRSPEKLVLVSPAGSETAFFPAMRIDHYLPSANLGQPYRQPLRAVGNGALIWSMSGGSLPPGLALDGASGEISGTPTETGIWQIQASVTDSWGQTVQKVISLHVLDSPVLENWARLVSTPLDDYGLAVAADAAGNSYLMTSVQTASPGLILTKYDPAGNELWSYLYDQGENDWFAALTVTPAGEVLIGGTRSHSAYLVIKLSASGELLWTKTHTVGETAYADGIAVDAEGDLRVTGHSWMDGAKLFTAKLSPQGDELWRQIYQSSNFAWPKDVAVDQAGNTYVAGEEAGPPDYDFLLLKYDTDGNLIWVRKEDAGEHDTWESIALDQAGNPHVSGHRVGMMVTRKYDSSGAGLWSAEYDPSGTPNGFSVAVDGGGRTYVSGVMHGSGQDFLVLCYSPSGQLLWERTSDAGGPPEDPNQGWAAEGAMAMALGRPGEIFATGYSWNGTDYDALTIKYGLTPLSLAQQELPVARLLTPYSYTFTPLGGVAPFTWSVASGALPQGLTLDLAGGQITGIPVGSGTSSFTVRVADAMGRSSEQEVTLAAMNLSADFTATPLVGYAPLTVNFSDASAGAASSWSWSFGDGGTSSAPTPSYLYQSPGTYSVTLSTGNAMGSDSKTAADYITVLACLNQPARKTGTFTASYADPQSAYAGSSDGETIQLQALDFTGDLIFDRDIRVGLKGGYDCGYSSSTAKAGILGKLAVKNGAVKLENLRFQ